MNEIKGKDIKTETNMENMEPQKITDDKPI